MKPPAVGVNIRVGWPVDRPIAMLLDMDYQTPAVELIMIPAQVGISMQRQQIVYVPEHRRDEYIMSPKKAVDEFWDIQRGFITSMSKHGVMCRYFTDGSFTGDRLFNYELRTKCNGECAKFDDVFPYEYTEQRIINKVWNEFVEAR